jgi:hypothetical protein
MRVRPIAICGLSGSTRIFYNTSQTAQFLEKSYWMLNACFDIFYRICPKHFLF